MAASRDDAPKTQRDAPHDAGVAAETRLSNAGASDAHNGNELHGSSGSELHGSSDGEQLPSTAAFTFSKESAQTLGKFRILRLVGRGAFGEVYQAYDTQLHRYVALKLPRSGIISPPDESAFLREAKNVSRLQHPGIVPVYDAGRSDESCYIVSEFVDGITLAQELRGKHLRFHDSAMIVAQLAAALDHAHRHGVIHRDLKPSNILLDSKHDHGSSGSFRGRPAELPTYFPRIVDFGLGKRSMADASISLEGHVLGTPSYMSPEAAAGNSHLVDSRSDVYSLGVILYELLVGNVPFHGETLLNQVLYDPPKRPRTLLKTVPRDLEVICLKCLEKDPRKRYQTAAELADDLNAWLEGLPIKARPASIVERGLRWCYRRAALSAMVLVTIMAVIAAAVGLRWNAHSRQEAAYAELKSRVERLGQVAPDQLGAALARFREQLPKSAVLIERYKADPELSEADHSLFELALLPTNPETAVELVDSLLSASPEYFDVYRRELQPFASAILPTLWTAGTETKESDANDSKRQLRALCALAQYDASDGRWQAAAPILSQLLVSESPRAAELWAGQCGLVQSLLLPSISAAFHSGELPPASRAAAAYVLSVLLADDPARIAEFLAKAQGDQLLPLLKAARRHKEQAAVALEARLSTLPMSPAADGSDEPAAKEQGNLCLSLLACDAESAVWRRLTDGRDPRARSYLIHSAGGGHLTSNRLAELLVASDNPDVQYTLLLMLGALEPGDLSSSHSIRLQKWLLSNYRENPDSGVHSAIEWLHRAWQRENELSPIQIDLMREGIRIGRNWYHNSLGQCLVIIDGPVTFMMGSPDEEPGHGPRELQHERTIRRRFAIAATETTGDQFDRSLGRSSDGDRSNSPAEGVTYADAIQYCHWLSQRETLSSSSPAVHIDKEEGTAAVDLQQTDYRLPSEAEWEYCCRGGTVTARFFGGPATALEPEYVQYSDRHGTARVGTKMPNRLGLFDTYGNVEEWTAGRSSPYPYEAGDDPDHLTFDEYVLTSRRGGSSSTRPNFFRSALLTTLRIEIGKDSPDASVGLRVARTLPAAPGGQ